MVNGDGKNSEAVNADAIIKEAKLLQSINHPNIVRVFDLKYDGRVNNRGTITQNTLYCVMQLANRGVMLGYLMIGGQLSENLARHYLRQLVEGMILIHSKGMVHRDLKPDNLLLRKNYELLIANFGHCSQDNINKLSERLGTIIYNPPELSSSSSSKYDGKAVDNLMVGVVLFILLTANIPFMVGAPNSDLFYKYLMDNSPEGFWSLQQSRDLKFKFSNDLKDLLTSLFAVKPSQRPELANVLQHKWFNGPVTSDAEVVAHIKKIYEQQVVNAQRQADEAVAKAAKAEPRNGGSSAYGGQGQRAVSVERDGMLEHLNKASDEIKRAVDAIVFNKDVPVYTNEGSAFFNSYFSALTPEELLKVATVVSNNMTENANVVINVNRYQVDYN